MIWILWWIVIILGVLACIASVLFIFNPYVKGWIRLKLGFCPLCNSSPPSPLCRVCYGETRYGRDLPSRTRTKWWESYTTYLYLNKER